MRQNARMRHAAVRACAAATSTGLASVVVGTFLPWFRSGAVPRNSYQAAAVLDRFGVFGGGLVPAALRAWLAVPLACATVLALFALGFPRAAATLAGIGGILIGTTAVLAYVQAGGTTGPVALAPSGPLTTAAGSGVALASALATVIAARRTTRGTVAGGARQEGKHSEHSGPG
jgi:hypothetical protein